MATTLIIDTYEVIEAMKAGGYTKEQAETLAKVLQKSDLSHLATRADLRTELKDLELRMTNTLTNRIIAVVGIGVALLALIKFL